MSDRLTFTLINDRVRNKRAGFREAQRYVTDVASVYGGDDCLVWPFARNSAGYGHIRLNKRNHLVSRLVCEIAHGSPPEGNYAAHSCGRGHMGCCSPKHLRWASPTENSADTSAHGTLSKGEKHGAAKLTLAEVSTIRALRGIETQRELAQRFGIAQSNVSLIQSGSTWR